MPNSDPEWQICLSTPYIHDRYFFLHTFLIYHIWFSKKNLEWNNTVSFKGFLLKLKEVDAISDRRSVSYVYV